MRILSPSLQHLGDSAEPGCSAKGLPPASLIPLTVLYYFNRSKIIILIGQWTHKEQEVKEDIRLRQRKVWNEKSHSSSTYFLPLLKRTIVLINHTQPSSKIWNALYYIWFQNIWLGHLYPPIFYHLLSIHACMQISFPIKYFLFYFTFYCIKINIIFSIIWHSGLTQW